ncbi:hypothetical protein I551_2186 [Mycobacterium ulcerans str. Harvey]|uniref:Uncharacterized protein n=1 Tax=Mycobacterium ulcerans str. Harvey TaxID=1299332 RepID=A0ABN0R2B7_MYCUL|nr:hypothetical protein I551_2186 [Mycobacterium ulcerans str. Harvey]
MWRCPLGDAAVDDPGVDGRQVQRRQGADQLHRGDRRQKAGITSDAPPHQPQRGGRGRTAPRGVADQAPQRRIAGWHARSELGSDHCGILPMHPVVRSTTASAARPGGF